MELQPGKLDHSRRGCQTVGRETKTSALLKLVVSNMDLFTSYCSYLLKLFKLFSLAMFHIKNILFVVRIKRFIVLTLKKVVVFFTQYLHWSSILSKLYIFSSTMCIF